MNSYITPKGDYYLALYKTMMLLPKADDKRQNIISLSKKHTRLPKTQNYRKSPWTKFTPRKTKGADQDKNGSPTSSKQSISLIKMQQHEM